MTTPRFVPVLLQTSDVVEKPALRERWDQSNSGLPLPGGPSWLRLVLVQPLVRLELILERDLPPARATQDIIIVPEGPPRAKAAVHGEAIKVH